MELDYLGNNFLGEVKNVSVFVGTYTFLVDFMIFDDITEFVLMRIRIGNSRKATPRVIRNWGGYYQWSSVAFQYEWCYYF